MQFLILLIFIPIFWLLIVRPQQVQRRAHQAVVASLAVGERVMTVGGLIGTLVSIDDDTVVIDPGDGTHLTFGRTFVRTRIDEVVGEEGPSTASSEVDAPGAAPDEVEDHVQQTEPDAPQGQQSEGAA